MDAKFNLLMFDQHRSSDTVRALEALLAQARSGDLRGIIFAAKYGTRRHDVGVTGEYIAEPIAGLGAAAKLMGALRKLEQQATDPKR